MVEKYQAGEGWGGQNGDAVLERIGLELSGKETPAGLHGWQYLE